MFVRMIVRSFTVRQDSYMCVRHINGEGAHRALSHQCACAEKLKWILDKQPEILSIYTLQPWYQPSLIPRPCMKIQGLGTRLSTEQYFDLYRWPILSVTMVTVSLYIATRVIHILHPFRAACKNKCKCKQ